MADVKNLQGFCGGFDTAAHSERNMAAKTLECGIEGGDLVIRCNMAHLAFLATRCDGTADMVVEDPHALALDVAKELMEESDDGTTPIHLMIDAALVAAMENGSEGFAE